MAQEMLKNEALLNLIYSVAKADEPFYSSEVFSNELSNESIWRLFSRHFSLLILVIYFSFFITWI